MRIKPSQIKDRAWELHRQHGHPKDYDGPCWGPTLAELDEAEAELRAKGTT